MLYSVGATYDPKMSQPNWAVARGTAGLRWPGPPTGYQVGLHGLRGPLTWIEGVLGVEAPSDMLNDSLNSLNSLLSSISGAQTQIQGYLGQAQGYDSSNDTTVQSKASACESQAAGLMNSYTNIQSTAQGILNAINVAKVDPNLTKATATTIGAQVSSLSDAVSTLQSGISSLGSNVSALIKYAASGPGIAQTLENTAVSSISTLTWVIGGGLMIYFLAPTFIPRLAGGIRRARSS